MRKRSRSSIAGSARFGPHDYARFVQPHMKALFARLDPSVPVIHFGTGTATLLELQRDAGGAVIGLDWRVDLDEAWRRLGPEVAVQGNLDPVVLLASRAEIEHQARGGAGAGGRAAGPHLQPGTRDLAGDAGGQRAVSG